MLIPSHQEAQADVVSQKLTGVARWLSLLVFGTLPLLYVPNFPMPMGYTKGVIALFALAISVALYAFAIARQGYVRVYGSVVLGGLWGTFAIALLSAFFSQDFFDAFWGSELTVHSAAFVGILALAATAWMSIATDAVFVIRLYLALALSAAVLALYHLVRIVIGPQFLTLGLFHDLTTTPLGDWGSLAIYFVLVIIISLIALEQLPLRRAGRVLFGGIVVLSLCMVALINFRITFFVLGVVGLVMVLYGLTKKHLTGLALLVPGRNTSSASLWLSALSLVVSVILVVSGNTFGDYMRDHFGLSYIEARPSVMATVGIANRVYEQHPIVGVGPNRFVDAWRQYRDQVTNATIFWNLDFQSGFGYIPTIFVTQGVLGGLAWIVFIILYLVTGIRTLLRPSKAGMTWSFITISSFTAGVYLWGMTIFYVPGSVLLLLAAVFTGIFLVARHMYMGHTGEDRSVMGTPRAVFLTIGATVIVVVLSIVALCYSGRWYTAAAYFARAMVLSNTDDGTRRAEVIAGVERAFTISPDDVYARQLATFEQAVLQSKVNGIIGKMSMDEATKADLQQTYMVALGHAQTAVALDPTDPNNQTILGRVYAAMVPFGFEEAYTLAKEAFEKARVLDPQNPQRYIVLADLELFRQDKEAALQYARQAVALKSNSTDAMFMLTQVEIARGNVAAAIESAVVLTMLDPENPLRYFHLGVLLYSEKRFAEAAGALERAIALADDYSNARYYLALAYSALQRTDDAMTQLRAVAAMNPENEEVRALISAIEQKTTTQTVQKTGATGTSTESVIQSSSPRQ